MWAERMAGAKAADPGAAATADTPKEHNPPATVAKEETQLVGEPAQNTQGQATEPRSRSSGATGPDLATRERDDDIKPARAGLAAGPPRELPTELGPLGEMVSSCRLCGLCESRTQAVFGQGDASAGTVMVIGEGPGEEEDAQGLPFVGRSGQLLDNMLAAIGLSRTDNVYITNVVKCRPPGNRNPTPEEVAACMPYLRRQIELLKPRLIVVLGKVAGNALVDEDAAMGKMRGATHEIEGVPAIATYHPAYYLRSPLEKRKGWEDLLLVKRQLGG